MDNEAAMVLRQLEERGEARVIVALRMPAADSVQAMDPAEVQRRIAEAQDDVLSALDPTSYRNPLRFTSVPSLTLTILTMGAYHALEAHPRVEKVDLDAGGVGADS